MAAADASAFRAKVNDLFLRAVEQPAAARAAFVAEAAAGDVELEREVQSLLAAHDRGAGVLEAPAGSAEALIARAVAAGRLEPGQRLGHYVIQRVLGEGGMGVVYLAEDTRLGRTVALKSLRAAAGHDAVRQERLRREARAAATLSHPGLATVYALEDIDGRMYLATEYVPGGTLRDEIDRGPLPPAASLQTVLDVARAMAAAHARGIVHRDLKPENVIRTDGGRLKVLDFGIAQMEGPARDQRLTIDGALLGTPAYMAPEQIRGEPVDARADVFALGVMLHEMLTGQRPFRGPTPAATMARILEAAPEPIEVPNEAAGAAVVARLREIVGRCLAKRPRDRFADAGALVLALLDARGEAPAQGETFEYPRRRPGAAGGLWWWQFHQGAASALYTLLIVPLWFVGEWQSSAAGLVVVIAGLASAVTAAFLRLHAWFAVRAYPAESTRLQDEWSGLRRAADWIFAAALAGGGLLILREHRYVGALLVAASAGVLVAALAIEPATARAARDGDRL
jgi:serine/threonine protein kinase